MSTPGGANVDGDAVGLALGVELGAETFAAPLPASHRKRSEWPGVRAHRRALSDRQMQRRSRRGFLGIDLVLLVHRLEQIGEAADGFRGAQEQKSLRLERVMERGERLLLQARLEINQQVAATDEIHARKRRVADEVLPGEDDHLAQRLHDPVAAFLLDKKAPQAFRRDVLHEALGVKTVAGLVQERVIEVGGEHLELAQAGRVLRRFHERHGNGIRLLAGGTAEHPSAERFVAAPLEKLGKDRALENVERFRVAEKTGHADERVGVEGVQLLGVAAEEMGVALQRVLLAQHHAPGDAPLDGGGFVEREIHAGMVAEEKQNLLEAVLRALGPLGRRLARFAPGVPPADGSGVHRPRAPSRPPGRLPPG